MTGTQLTRPRALCAGDRVAVVAPASPFDHAELEAGIVELGALGFEPVVDRRVYQRTSYVAGAAATRAAVLHDAWRDPTIRGMFAARGGYGSVHLLELLDRDLICRSPKVFVGYSDVTSLLTYLVQVCGQVCFHGPMVAGRLAAGPAAYDRTSLKAAIMASAPMGRLDCGPVEALRSGEATGLLVGGNLTQVAASLGTPFALVPPQGAILFLEDVNERPYRLDRMLAQLRLGGVLDRAGALVFGEMRGCDEPDGTLTARAAIARLIESFPGPVLYGVPAGHTSDGRPALTLPFGTRARVLGGPAPEFTIEEPAVRP